MWHDIDTDAIDARLMQDVIGDILNTMLNERERTVIFGIYMLDLKKKEVAERFRISAPRVGQLEAKALRKLRHRDVTKILAKCGVLAAEKALKDELERERQELLETKKREQKWRNAERRRAAKVLYKKYGVKSRTYVEEIEVKDYAPVVPPEHRIPPKQVILKYTPDGCPYLWLDPVYGTVERHKNPHVYQAWLEWLEKHGNDSLASRPELVLFRL